MRNYLEEIFFIGRTLPVSLFRDSGRRYGAYMEETSPAGESAAPARRVNDIDETGKTVAANVRRLRAQLGLTTQQLAERLTPLGRPIIANAITKIEQGRRRVDVDDLMALSIALGVTPNTLLLPHEVGGEHQPTAMPEPVPQASLWYWADGTLPLPSSVDPTVEGTESEEESERLEAEFRRQAAPQVFHPAAAFIHIVDLVAATKAAMETVRSAPALASHVGRLAEQFAGSWTVIADGMKEVSEGTRRVEDLRALAAELEELRAKAERLQ
ncbi:helix-turn-helix domain-containing protein [Streptomyces sp. NPDC059161]|uniref:helix-turn-helix domain-containing protein n=1 Tax=Streptomyces sp. NPDC059161 TaxID=3346749 RepID=UPI0036BA5524